MRGMWLLSFCLPMACSPPAPAPAEPKHVSSATAPVLAAETKAHDLLPAVPAGWTVERVDRSPAARGEVMAMAVAGDEVALVARGFLSKRPILLRRSQEGWTSTRLGDVDRWIDQLLFDGPEAFITSGWQLEGDALTKVIGVGRVADGRLRTEARAHGCDAAGHRRIHRSGPGLVLVRACTDGYVVERQGDGAWQTLLEEKVPLMSSAVEPDGTLHLLHEDPRGHHMVWRNGSVVATWNAPNVGLAATLRVDGAGGVGYVTVQPSGVVFARFKAGEWSSRRMPKGSHAQLEFDAGGRAVVVMDRLDLEHRAFVEAGDGWRPLELPRFSRLAKLAAWHIEGDQMHIAYHVEDRGFVLYARGPLPPR